MLSRDTWYTMPGPAGMKVGDEIRRDHKDCGDTRKRLYVLRKAHNLWLGHCFNCGEGGAYSGAADHPPSTDEVLKNLASLKEGEPILPDELVVDTLSSNLPLDCNTVTTTWDKWAIERIWQHHTDTGVVTDYPYLWQFSPSLNQIIVPIHSTMYSSHGHKGYQARLAPGQKPKAITTYFPTHNGHPILYTGVSNTLVIVEDPLSALRVHKDRGDYVVCLLGKHLTELGVSIIRECVALREIDKIVIWLDDDIINVDDPRRICERLQPYMPHRAMVHVMKHREAKNMDIHELKGLVI